MALSFRFNFAVRAFTLPFFTVLEPSEKSTKQLGKRHKTTLDLSIQIVLQLVRWAPFIPFILVGDGGFACGKLAWTCFKNNIAPVSRLKMNARIYGLPEEAPAGKRVRKPKKGARLISFYHSMLNWTSYECRREAPIIAEKAAWYDKKVVTFTDLLKAVRVDLWKDNIFFRKEFSDPSVKIQLGNEEMMKAVKDFIVRILMQAA